ncbi:MAG TPA: hypothetical protein VN207_03045 [Ktedonobacteraceae bacterium]|nr:hypothetical protein [Ktedonobacteraceae bacterium]
MKHVSLNQIKPSGLTKIAGLFVLAILAIGFFVFPFAAFAGCGKPQDIQVKATFFIPGDKLHQAALSQVPSANAKTNATVGTSNPATLPVAPKSITSALSTLKFQPFVNGTSLLANDTIFLGTSKQKDGTVIPIMGVVINGNPIVFTNGGKGTAKNVKFVGENKASDPTPD